MQIHKAPINDRLLVSKTCFKAILKIRHSNYLDFAVIYPQNLLFLKKLALVSIAFSVDKQNFTAP